MPHSCARCRSFRLRERRVDCLPHVQIPSLLKLRALGYDKVAALPPVSYKGITFTMPNVLWQLFGDNRSLADALPALAAGAIEALILARHGLRTGVIAILHTFNGRLEFNLHVHTMVTAGGLQASSNSWSASVYYDNDILMRMWRTAVLTLLCAAHQAEVLRTQMTSEELAAMLKEQERWWSVKIQSFKSVEQFLRYAGRYARRLPIAQHRIIIGQGNVAFWAKDKISKRLVLIRCSLGEFIDRWAQHIPKRYQHGMRYFGLFAPRALTQTADAIFAATGHKRPPRPAPLRWAESLKQMSGKDPLLDRTGQRMYWVRRLAPQPSY
jgi:Putative transposase